MWRTWMSTPAGTAWDRDRRHSGGRSASCARSMWTVRSARPGTSSPTGKIPPADNGGFLLLDRPMIRVAVIDDHPIARHGVEQMLADAFEVVASVATAADLVALDTRHTADVVIMDLYHDGELPCLAAIADLAAVARVLVISASGQASDVIGAIQAGASGYVTKHAES